MHDLTGKSLYLAVRCDKNNKHIIPLKVIQFQDDGSNAEVWGGLPPFDVTCEICENSQKSIGDQVIVWLGPQSDKNFQTHAAFQRR